LEVLAAKIFHIASKKQPGIRHTKTEEYHQQDNGVSLTRVSIFDPFIHRPELIISGIIKYFQQELTRCCLRHWPSFFSSVHPMANSM